jgi:hypothetical protein
MGFQFEIAQLFARVSGIIEMPSLKSIARIEYRAESHR